MKEGLQELEGNSFYHTHGTRTPAFEAILGSAGSTPLDRNPEVTIEGRKYKIGKMVPIENHPGTKGWNISLTAIGLQ